MNNTQSNIDFLETSVRLYSLSRAATLLGIGRDTLLTLIDNGEIATVRVVGRLKISLAELLRFIQQDHKPIPIVLHTTPESKKENIPTYRIDRSKIDEIFNNVKKEVTTNEQTK
jgi:excisionase family DNA binding protein